MSGLRAGDALLQAGPGIALSLLYHQGPWFPPYELNGMYQRKSDPERPPPQRAPDWFIVICTVVGLIIGGLVGATLAGAIGFVVGDLVGGVIGAMAGAAVKRLAGGGRTRQ